MVLTPILLIVISSIGYLYFTSSKYGRLRLKRLSAGALTINIIAYGALFVGGGTLLTLLLSMMFLKVEGLSDTFQLPVSPDAFLSFSGLGWDYQVPPALFIALMISILLARLDHKISSKGKERNALSDVGRLRQVLDDEMDSLLVDALEADNVGPIQSHDDASPLLLRVVLKNRKVYIGNLLKCDLLHGVSNHIVLQPMHSGYQDNETLELHLTDHYQEHFSLILQKEIEALRDMNLSPEAKNKIFLEVEKVCEQYAVTIPVCEVVTASLFSLPSYTAFLKAKRNRDGYNWSGHGKGMYTTTFSRI